MVANVLMGRVAVENELRAARDLSLESVNGMSLRVDATGSLFAEKADASYALTQGARKGFLRHTGLTDKFVNELAASDSGLASDVATAMYRGRGSEGVFAMQGDVPISFARRGKLSLLPVDDVLEGIESALGEDVQYSRALQGRDMEVQIEVVGARSESVVVGDVIQSGVMVRFNPLGLTNPFVAPYGLRLECSNGMTSRTEYGGGELPLVAYHDSPVKWIIEQCQSAYEGLPAAVEEWGKLREHAVHPDARRLVVSRALDEAGIKGRQADAVFDKAMAEPPSNLYDVLNLITWASSHVLENPNAVMRVQDSTVNFTRAVTTEHRCPVCRRDG